MQKQDNSMLPLSRLNIFDPRLCPYVELEGYHFFSSFADKCSHITRSGKECELINCPLLSNKQKAIQLYKRSRLVRMPPPPNAKILAYGEDWDNHGPNKIYKWDERVATWVKRAGSFEECEDVNFIYSLPSREVECRWILEHFEKNCPQSLIEIGADKTIFPEVIIPSDLFDGLKEVNLRIIEYLQKHPYEIDKISPFLFEDLVAEVMASWGWDVELVANKSSIGADILATTKTFGDCDPILYFVEIKKMKDKVGIEIIDRILGAMTRHRPEPHVGMIVSLSGFKNIRDQRHWNIEKREYKRVRLKGRDDIVEWLRDYKPTSKGGLWLPKKWSEDIP